MPIVLTLWHERLHVAKFSESMMCVFDSRCCNEDVSGLQDSLLRSDTWLHTYHEARDVENLYGHSTHPLGLFVAPRNNKQQHK